MNTSRTSTADRLIGWATVCSVLVLAAIAAVISYRHMHSLVTSHDDTTWAAALLPLSVDGMIITASIALLADSRRGRRGGLLPWLLLITGSAASLAANIAVAEPSVTGRVIAAWPSLALIGSYELLMRHIRHTTQASTHLKINEIDTKITERPDTSDIATVSEQPSARRTATQAPSDDSANGQPPASDLQYEAWAWALAHASAHGKLPSGKTIAGQFERSERWGRHVKQAGQTGTFTHTQPAP